MSLGQTQYDLLSYLASTPEGKIRRLQGGFWTPEDIEDPQEAQVTTDLKMVRTLETKGFLVRCNDHSREDRDSRRLTPKGVEALNSPRIILRKTAGSLA